MAGFIYFITATDIVVVVGPTDDVMFVNVSLLIKTTGVVGDNNSFIDSSSFNHVITKTGVGQTQGAFSPFSNSWSTYFNGTTDNFSTNVNVINSLTGNYTIEAWVNLQGVPGSSYAGYNLITGTNGSQTYHTYAITATGYTFITNDGASFVNITAITPTIGKWAHLAFVSIGSLLTVYLNGTSIGFAYMGTGWSTSSTYTEIGAYATIGRFNGFISNLRIVGSAVYTANFTPSIVPLTAIPGTTLLTFQSNRFIDNSTNNYPITVVGTPSIQQFNPFMPPSTYSTTTDGSSMYFNGSSAIQTSQNNAALVIGAADFTLECWVYATTTSSGNAMVLGNYGLDNAIFLQADGSSLV
jgi:hypothetical protein